MTTSRGSTRVLAVADEITELLYGDALSELRPDLIISCGDLPFDYLENLVSRTDRPLVYVPGNHDPDLRPPDRWAPLAFDPPPAGVAGAENIDGRVVHAGGLTVAGLGGSVRYRVGPNQYTQAQMTRRALRLELSARLDRALRRRPLDVLVAHSPALGFGDGEDPPHAGFAALRGLVTRLRPRLFVHGHVHRRGTPTDDMRLGETLIVNAIPYRLLEI